MTKYRVPPWNVILIGSHTSLCTSSKSLEALVTSSLRKDVLWCLPSMQTSHTVQWHFFQIHAIDHFLQLLKTRHVEVAKSLVLKHSSLIWKFCHICILFPNIDIEKVQVLLPLCFCHNGFMDIVHLTRILVKLHFQALWNEFVNKNETIFHFGNMKNLNDGCKRHSTSNLHCGLDAPFANDLKNGVISHVHLPWNNGFISGEPFLFKCHVLCCAKTDDPIICCMIINSQSDNKNLFLIFTSLVCFFFLITFLFQTIRHTLEIWVFNNLKTSLPHT